MLVCLQFKFFICSFPLFPNHSLSSSFSRRTSQICPHCFSTKLHISHSPVYVLLQFAWHILKCLFCTGYIKCFIVFVAAPFLDVTLGQKLRRLFLFCISQRFCACLIMTIQIVIFKHGCSPITEHIYL